MKSKVVYSKDLVVGMEVCDCKHFPTKFRVERIDLEGNNIYMMCIDGDDSGYYKESDGAICFSYNSLATWYI